VLAAEITVVWHGSSRFPEVQTPLMMTMQAVVLF